MFQFLLSVRFLPCQETPLLSLGKRVSAACGNREKPQPWHGPTDRLGSRRVTTRCREGPGPGPLPRLPSGCSSPCRGSRGSVVSPRAGDVPLGQQCAPESGVSPVVSNVPLGQQCPPGLAVSPEVSSVPPGQRCPPGSAVSPRVSGVPQGQQCPPQSVMSPQVSSVPLGQRCAPRVSSVPPGQRCPHGSAVSPEVSSVSPGLWCVPGSAVSPCSDPTAGRHQAGGGGSGRVPARSCPSIRGCTPPPHR